MFADATFEITDKFEIDAAIRYDEDRRENTTETPQPFIPQPDPPPAPPTVFTGEVRTHTWSEPQPKITLRYKPTDDVTLYGGYSRGFRSGGFNQTGVGAVADASGIAGVNDLFDAEVADTYEVGVKGQFLDRRLDLDVALFHTESTNGYFFVFLAANSTQNLGNLDADLQGRRDRAERHTSPTASMCTRATATRTARSPRWRIRPSWATRRRWSRATRINAGLQYRQPAQRRPGPDLPRSITRISARPGGTRTTSPRAIRSISSTARIGARTARSGR